jgi:hypothetical protein
MPFRVQRQQFAIVFYKEDPLRIRVIETLPGLDVHGLAALEHHRAA